MKNGCFAFSGIFLNLLHFLRFFCLATSLTTSLVETGLIDPQIFFGGAPSMTTPLLYSFNTGADQQFTTYVLHTGPSQGLKIQGGGWY